MSGETVKDEIGIAYQELAVAIVTRACLDYHRHATKAANGKDRRTRAKHAAEVREIERFFHSKWFAQLFDVDPEELMKEMLLHKPSRIDVVCKPYGRRKHR